MPRRIQTLLVMDSMSVSLIVRHSYIYSNPIKDSHLSTSDGPISKVFLNFLLI